MIQRNEFMNKNKKIKDELEFSSGEKGGYISDTQMIPSCQRLISFSHRHMCTPLSTTLLLLHYLRDIRHPSSVTK